MLSVEDTDLLLSLGFKEHISNGIGYTNYTKEFNWYSICISEDNTFYIYSDKYGKWFTHEQTFGILDIEYIHRLAKLLISIR